MSAATLTRSVVEASAPARPLSGAAVYDADGYRLGFVDAVDPLGNSFTLLEAGYILGLLARTCQVPVACIDQANTDRVDLNVPARALKRLWQTC